MKRKDHFIEAYGDAWLRISIVATKKPLKKYEFSLFYLLVLINI